MKSYSSTNGIAEFDIEASSHGLGVSTAGSPLGDPQQDEPIIPSRPRFLVLDLARVTSLDASAVHSCFIPIARLTAVSHARTTIQPHHDNCNTPRLRPRLRPRRQLQPQLRQGLDVKLVFAGCRPAVQSQLLKHGVFSGDHIQSYASVHMALNWCESVILKAAARAIAPPTPVPRKSATVPAGGIHIFDTPSTTAERASPERGAHTGMMRRDSSDLTSRHLKKEPVPVLEVDTVLRQWMGMRPEQVSGGNQQRMTKGYDYHYYC